MNKDLHSRKQPTTQQIITISSEILKDKAARDSENLDNLINIFKTHFKDFSELKNINHKDNFSNEGIFPLRFDKGQINNEIAIHFSFTGQISIITSIAKINIGKIKPSTTNIAKIGEAFNELGLKNYNTKEGKIFIITQDFEDNTFDISQDSIEILTGEKENPLKNKLANFLYEVNAHFMLARETYSLNNYPENFNIAINQEEFDNISDGSVDYTLNTITVEEEVFEQIDKAQIDSAIKGRDFDLAADLFAKSLNISDQDKNPKIKSLFEKMKILYDVIEGKDKDHDLLKTLEDFIKDAKKDIDSFDVTELFFEGGILDIKDKKGYSIFDYATGSKNTDLVKFFLASGHMKQNINSYSYKAWLFSHSYPEVREEVNNFNKNPEDYVKDNKFDSKMTDTGLSDRLKYLVKIVKEHNVAEQEKFAKHAINTNNIEELRDFIEYVPERINKLNNLGKTLLHLACQDPSVTTEIVQVLIDAGENINSLSKNPFITEDRYLTPLHYALLSNNIEVIEFLIEAGADLNIQNEAGETSLDLAINLNNPEIAVKVFNKLTEYGADLETNVSARISKAIEKGYTEIAKSLSLTRSKIDQKNLDSAIEVGNLEILKALAKNGADLKINGYENLSLAIKNSYTEIAIFLINNKAVDLNNQSVIDLVFYSGEVEIVKALLNNAVEINSAMLLKAIDNLRLVAVGDSNKMALITSPRKTEILKFLLEQSVNPNFQDSLSGDTPLIKASKIHDKEAVEVLLKNGAEIDPVNKDGDNALDIALKKGRHDVAALLLIKLLNKDDCYYSNLEELSNNIYKIYSEGNSKALESFVEGLKNFYPSDFNTIMNTLSRITVKEDYKYDSSNESDNESSKTEDYSFYNPDVTVVSYTPVAIVGLCILSMDHHTGY